MKIKLLSILAFLLLFAAGCDRCRNPKVIDAGELTAEQLALVPYTDGQVVRFLHSEGLIIDYNVSRSTTIEMRDYSGKCEMLKFRIDKTSLIPEYPALAMNFYVANTDENYTAFEASIGKYYFYLPKDTENFFSYGTLGDMPLNDTLYTDVFFLKTPAWSIPQYEVIYVDSLYYNYTTGVIRITMSNSEKYTIYE
ncbi:MAG: hypothetical protein R6W67_05490 [Bacteroidales bacterium]